MSTEHDTVVVVVAAGASTRFGSDKLAETIGGATVLEHAVAALRRALPLAPLALVVAPDRVGDAAAEWEPRGVTVVAGGRRRQDSVRNGFDALRPADDAVVVIHDGARPAVPPGDVAAVAESARDHGAALLVAPISDTVKRLDGGGRVTETVPRDGLARALTPQAFRAAVLRRAWEAAGDDVWTDEASLVEAAGASVHAVEGDPRNVKVTVRRDLEGLTGDRVVPVRVGHGVDVHAFGPGRRLVLCGVELPSPVGLVGHSDADVALHAVTDAVLGACGGGDIGVHFPPTDERWRDAASGRFLAHAVALAAERGWRPAQCDLTLLAEQPRIGPHRERMIASLAGLLGLPEADVGLKATTCEGMGFVGRKEGMMALAVVTLARV